MGGSQSVEKPVERDFPIEQINFIDGLSIQEIQLVYELEGQSFINKKLFVFFDKEFFYTNKSKLKAWIILSQMQNLDVIDFYNKNHESPLNDRKEFNIEEIKKFITGNIDKKIVLDPNFVERSWDAGKHFKASNIQNIEKILLPIYQRFHDNIGGILQLEQVDRIKKNFQIYLKARIIHDITIIYFKHLVAGLSDDFVENQLIENVYKFINSNLTALCPLNELHQKLLTHINNNYTEELMSLNIKDKKYFCTEYTGLPDTKVIFDEFIITGGNTAKPRD